MSTKMKAVHSRNFVMVKQNIQTWVSSIFFESHDTQTQAMHLSYAREEEARALWRKFTFQWNVLSKSPYPYSIIQDSPTSVLRQFLFVTPWATYWKLAALQTAMTWYLAMVLGREWSMRFSQSQIKNCTCALKHHIKMPEESKVRLSRHLIISIAFQKVQNISGQILNATHSLTYFS